MRLKLFDKPSIMKNELTSKETKLTLKVSDCKLMHLREEGILRAEKEGRKYMYLEEDVMKYLKVTKEL